MPQSSVSMVRNHHAPTSPIQTCRNGTSTSTTATTPGVWRKNCGSTPPAAASFSPCTATHSRIKPFVPKSCMLKETLDDPRCLQPTTSFTDPRKRGDRPLEAHQFHVERQNLYGLPRSHDRVGPLRRR